MNFQDISKLDLAFERKAIRCNINGSPDLHQVRRDLIDMALDTSGVFAGYAYDRTLLLEARAALLDKYLEVDDDTFPRRIIEYPIADRLVTTWYDQVPDYPHPQKAAELALAKVKVIFEDQSVNALIDQKDL